MDESGRATYPLHYVDDVEELLEAPLEEVDRTPDVVRYEAAALAGFVGFVNRQMGG
jgi:hypothetical protein